MAERRFAGALAFENLRDEVDKGVAQKGANRNTDEQNRQLADARLVHGDREKADEGNQTHRNYTGDGQESGSHAMLQESHRLLSLFALT
jgi:hypothetical protein